MATVKTPEKYVTSHDIETRKAFQYWFYLIFQLYGKTKIYYVRKRIFIERWKFKLISFKSALAYSMCINH